MEIQLEFSLQPKKMERKRARKRTIERKGATVSEKARHAMHDVRKIENRSPFPAITQRAYDSPRWLGILVKCVNRAKANIESNSQNSYHSMWPGKCGSRWARHKMPKLIIFSVQLSSSATARARLEKRECVRMRAAGWYRSLDYARQLMNA